MAVFSRSFTVRDYHPFDQAAVLDLGMSELHRVGYSLDLTTHPHSYPVIKVLEVEGQVEGFVYTRRYDGNAAEGYESEDLAGRPFYKGNDLIDSGEPFAVVYAIVVGDKYSGYGLGNTMSRETLARLKEEGAHHVYAVTWNVEPREGVRAYRLSAEGVLERTGFSPVCTIPGYWAKLVESRGYTCPLCQTGPCRCVAVIYGRGLENFEG